MMKEKSNYYNEYEKLIKIINHNFKENGLRTLVFESYTNLEETIYDFPSQKLLCIKDNTKFLYEAYYKILDRVIDDRSYLILMKQLEENRISKLKIIENLCNSEECKIKKTSIQFEIMEA